MSSSYDYLIVGSGLSGAVFAHEATKRGKRCLVLEKRPHLGGNVYTEMREGIAVHCYGAHIFHTDNERVWGYVNSLTEFNRYINSPVANFEGALFNLPFNMNTFYALWGTKTPAEAKAKLESQRVHYDREPANLKEQALSLVGHDIYEKLIRGYTEKQWNRPCTELPAFIIKRLPLRFTFDNNYFTSRFQGIPSLGYTTLIAKLLSGTEIRLDTDFLTDKQGFKALAKKAVYTGMIDAYFEYALGQLHYRSLRFEHEVLDEENHQGVGVVNYTDAQTPYTRSIEHKHFVYGTQPKTVVTKEYSLEWQPGMEPYYPVNDAANQALYGRYAEAAKAETRDRGTIFLGRLAKYAYYDMDQAILASLEAAEKELDL
ncbi:UDP-galactopyranose mutase [Treponema primitia ZAS-2]|uniref:UDP-galactopyranose mutase n=1 Tax=Treponema primitia (strain ATCC BAA-887 / DSM 12427 / ZAS-2) TaxID=545694 RepID=F5YGP4_TREPZ|nr:UDP-galactopyranose mutase [Treponema primitia]AEF86867.1 UDP-galactopyranose mutase [Treponema primitia ZAS-2]